MWSKLYLHSSGHAILISLDYLSNPKLSRQSLLGDDRFRVGEIDKNELCATRPELTSQITLADGKGIDYLNLDSVIRPNPRCRYDLTAIVERRKFLWEFKDGLGLVTIRGVGFTGE